MRQRAVTQGQAQGKSQKLHVVSREASRASAEATGQSWPFAAAQLPLLELLFFSSPVVSTDASLTLTCITEFKILSSYWLHT